MQQQITSGINIMFHFEIDGKQVHPAFRHLDFVPRVGELVSFSEPYFFGEVTTVMFQPNENGEHWVNIYLKSTERKNPQ